LARLSKETEAKKHRRKLVRKEKMLKNNVGGGGRATGLEEDLKGLHLEQKKRKGHLTGPEKEVGFTKYWEERNAVKSPYIFYLMGGKEARAVN